MNYNQIAILFLQGFLVVFVILLLFRHRKKLGIGVLLACLGLFQFVQVFLSSAIYVSITNNFIVSPGSSIFFTATLFALLIIYIKDDAGETKKATYALFIVNILMVIILRTLGWYFNYTSTVNLLEVAPPVLYTSSKVLLVGTIALFLDSLLIIIIFEFISRKVRFLFLQICITMLIVLSFDTLFFSTLAFWNYEKLHTIIISALISKGVFTFFYSILFYVYLRYFDYTDKELVYIKIKDVFRPISYKQKFETAVNIIKKAEEEREQELISANNEKEKRIKELELSKQDLQITLELIKENEYWLKEAGRMAKIGYWRYDKVTDTIFWSDAIHEMYGNDIEKGVPKIEVILDVFNEESRKKLIKATVLLANEGTPYEIDLKITNFKNETRWIRNIGEPIYNDKNEIIGRRGISQDITEQKRKQQILDYQQKKLQELNSNLNEAQKLSHVGSWKWNMTTDEAEWSDEMYNIYGVSKESFYPSNENVSKTILPEDLYKIEQGISSLLVDKTFVPFDFRIKRPSGEIRNLYIMALERKSQENLFGVTKDITEQKRIEEKNLLITERYKNIFNNSTASIWDEDLSLLIAQINELKKLKIPNIRVYLEQHPKVLFSLVEKIKVNKVNNTTLKLFKANSHQEFFENIQYTFGSGSSKVFAKFIESIWNNKKTFTSEVNYKTLKGEEFAAVISIPIPQTAVEQKTVPVSSQSIQSIKEAESAKKESLNKLNEAQKLAKIGSWVLTPSTQEVEWSEEAFNIFGFNSKKGVPDFETQLKVIHPEDKELVTESIRLGKPFDIEHRIIQLDGAEKWIRSIGNPILGDDGTVINLTGSYQDITVQKRNLAEIRKADEMYRLLTDNSYDLICLHEPNSSFKYISPSVKNLLGYEQSEFIGKKIFNKVHSDDIKILKKAIGKNSFKGTVTDAFSIRIRHKEGHYVWLEFLSSPVYRDKKINYFVTSARDITQWVLAKNEIQDYQKSLQRMTTEMTLIEEKQKKEIASNIHDYLSQSLVVSNMRINELRKKSTFKKIDKDLSFIEKHISEALENSRKITYELSPPVLYQLGIIDALNWLLEDVEATHNIECRINSNVNYINLNEMKSILLYRCVQELLKNAIKYAKATLFIFKLDRNELGINIILTDNGVGFNTSLLNNHRSHTGSGFGLFAVQERVRNIQGEFKITSKINKGTTVKIFIPLTK